MEEGPTAVADVSKSLEEASGGNGDEKSSGWDYSHGKLKMQRYFSEPFDDVYKDPKNIIRYLPRTVEIKDDLGNVLETIEGAVFPESWGQNPANTVATKYFRKSDVPEKGRERDIRELAGRVGKKISQWGVEQSYFDIESAKVLEHELVATTIGQYAAFNSPVWFNLGLDLYGIKQEGSNFYIEDGQPRRVHNYYANPQVSACFIVSPEDSIESMINVSAEISSEIFRGGSGIGGDWSRVRSAGEPISGGGVASGAKRFQDVQDAVARVVKSGGKTRRAATMQSIGAWHPDMIDIIRDKYAEDTKGRILVEAGAPSEWESPTFQNLRGQNVNISVRTDDAFWQAYERDELYDIRFVKSGEVKERRKARDIAKIMAFTAHGCGDPGIQNDTIINRWNTCPNSGRINASNPCSEYMFLDNSACNLASINLLRFRREDGTLDIGSFTRAADIYVTSQDIMISKASYPTKEIALNSHRFRPIGLGYANLGAYIMANGWAYDSNEARDFAAAVTSLLTAESALQSTRLAETIGVFEEYEKNKGPMMNVMEMHRKASRQLKKEKGLEEIIETANKKWDEAIERGKKHGFRNAQFTLLAPTGTIGFMMGCDTTGCEPEYQLVKYKELAGGGAMIIINETVPVALKTLGYDSDKIEKIVSYVNENMPDGKKRGTVEGCPDLKPEHLPVFDCSISSPYGARFISPRAHIEMLGAIQPHLSGAISKTINCPEDTTVEEMEELMYMGWKRGVKALALYRDGSKAAQPLKKRSASKLVNLVRGEREPLPKERQGMIRKVKVGGINLFLTTGEYEDGRLGELFIESLERGSEVNRLLNIVAIEFSEKIQYGVPLEEALEIFQKAGNSQIAGVTDHEFIKLAKGPEGFLYDFLRAHYLGDISPLTMNGETKKYEMRPLPWELRVFKRVPKLHLIPSVAGVVMYPGVPTLEETITGISKTNYWCDSQDGLDTRRTIEKIRKTRSWGKESNNEFHGRITGKMCDKGHLMISDGGCFKCPICKTSTGGCGGG